MLSVLHFNIVFSFVQNICVNRSSQVGCSSLEWLVRIKSSLEFGVCSLVVGVLHHLRAIFHTCSILRKSPTEINGTHDTLIFLFFSVGEGTYIQHTKARIREFPQITGHKYWSVYQLVCETFGTLSKPPPNIDLIIPLHSRTDKITVQPCRAF